MRPMTLNNTKITVPLLFDVANYLALQDSEEAEKLRERVLNLLTAMICKPELTAIAGGRA